jgi:hypothetical protein
MKDDVSRVDLSSPVRRKLNSLLIWIWNVTSHYLIGSEYEGLLTFLLINSEAFSPSITKSGQPSPDQTAVHEVKKRDQKKAKKTKKKKPFIAIIQ